MIGAVAAGCDYVQAETSAAERLWFNERLWLTTGAKETWAVAHAGSLERHLQPMPVSSGQHAEARPEMVPRNVEAVDPTVVLARATPEGEAEYQALITTLRQVWSDLTPIPGQPSLSTVDVKSGIWVVGRRNYDADTRTYRTYRVVRWGYVPLLFLGTYRVYETPRGGLLFIGRHPLPTWARAWNAVGILAALGMAFLLAAALAESLRWAAN